MKILHINDTFAPAGGIQTYILKLLPLLEASGHRSVVIYRREHHITPAAKWKSVYYVKKTKDRELDQAHIVEIIGQEQPDIVYLHALYEPEIIAEVARLVPTVAYVHNFYPVCPGLGKYYRRGDMVCERSFGLGCASMIYLRRCATARHPRSVYQIMRATQTYNSAYQTLDRIIVASTYMYHLMIQNGFNTDRISVLTPHFEEPHSIVEPQQDLPLILFAGRLEAEKGLPYLLKALTYIQTPCRLLVAGDGTCRAEYEALSEELGVADRVDFVGWLDDAGLQTAYQNTTLLVMPGIWPEPFGKVGIEALAHNRPVVAFSLGGISDWLKDGYNGFLVPPKDTRQLAARMDQILSDPALAKHLGSNGRRYVECNYKPKQHVDQLLQIFEAAIQSN